MATYGDHEYQFQYDLRNEERVKDFYSQQGYNFEVVVEQARTWQAGLPAMVPIFDVRRLNSFTLGGHPAA